MKYDTLSDLRKAFQSGKIKELPSMVTVQGVDFKLYDSTEYHFTDIINENFDPCFFLGECGGETRFDQSHNIIFDNLVDGGIFGLLGYLSILFRLFIFCGKIILRKELFF